MSYYDRNTSWKKVKRGPTGAVLTRGEQIFSRLEKTPDINRGMTRFAAEVALLKLQGWPVPIEVEAKARNILCVLAKG